MQQLRVKNLKIVFSERKDGNMKDAYIREKFIRSVCPYPVYIPNQKHTTVITSPENTDIPADGIFIGRKKTAGGVLTADCMPVVLTDFEKLAVIHAGWKGLLGGIIEKGIQMFPDPQKLTAFIGVSARDCCYEIQEDFIKENNIPEKYIKRGSLITFSMQKTAKDIMKKYGIEKIIDISLCTICNPEFFSYRKGDFYERILTLAWLED
ncbi:polyphenol oxidase family protein [Persephonella sp.]